MWITWQFFVLVLIFGLGWLKFSDSTETVVIQTYVVAFTLPGLLARHQFGEQGKR